VNEKVLQARFGRNLAAVHRYSARAPIRAWRPCGYWYHYWWAGIRSVVLLGV